MVQHVTAQLKQQQMQQSQQCVTQSHWCLPPRTSVDFNITIQALQSHTNLHAMEPAVTQVTSAG